MLHDFYKKCKKDREYCTKYDAKIKKNKSVLKKTIAIK